MQRLQKNSADKKGFHAGYVRSVCRNMRLRRDLALRKLRGYSVMTVIKRRQRNLRKTERDMSALPLHIMQMTMQRRFCFRWREGAESMECAECTRSVYLQEIFPLCVRFFVFQENRLRSTLIKPVRSTGQMALIWI